MLELTVTTRSRVEWIDITERVSEVLPQLPATAGAVLVYCPHTTAGVTVNEGWDPTVAADVARALQALVPDIPYQHGEGNSPAHVLSTITGCSVVIPVQDRCLRLGRWQRLFLCEYDGPRQRRVWITPLAGGF